MDHPLIAPEQKELRQRVVQLLKNSYKSHRSSNIVFVCGGNDDTHMRMLFRAHCNINMPEFEIFFPEYAMDNIFSTEAAEPFDIAEFEELICELSHAIVIFPEAPGSFAETGYFSAIDLIARRCILVLNLRFQPKDSFISLGPARKIAEKTVFHPLIHIDYQNPEFDAVLERIKRIDKRKYKKNLTIEKFRELSSYEICCVIHEVVGIMSIATIDDIAFIFTAIFGNRFSRPKVRKLISILVGARYLINCGDYGHMTINPNKARLLELRDGRTEDERAIRLSLAELYQDCAKEFRILVEASRDAN